MHVLESRQTSRYESMVADTSMRCALQYAAAGLAVVRIVGVPAAGHLPHPDPTPQAGDDVVGPVE
jgi:hypothetical protein